MNLPTGDARAGFGSGMTNGGLAVLADQRIGERFMLYANAGVGFVHALKALQTVELRNYYYGDACIEWVVNRRLGLGIQYTIQSSPYPTTGDISIDNPAMLLSVGSRYRIGDKSSLSLSLTEDPDVAGAPDIMISSQYRRTF